MLLEDQRFIHEDLERLEQGISDRVAEEPRQIRDRLSRDHQIAGFLDRIQSQSQRLLDIYKDADGARSREIQTIGTGEPMGEFYKQLSGIKSFHAQYPNEPVENLEQAYKKRTPREGELVISEIDNMFSGEENFGRFLDLTSAHETYINLPGIKRPVYLQYLDIFDAFTPPLCAIKRPDKMTDQYFSYVGGLANYLESFMKRTRPLENLDQLFKSFDEDFEKSWDASDIAGWTLEVQATGRGGGGTWCADCEKEFNNHNVYEHHLTSKKHVKNAERRSELQKGADAGRGPNPIRLKERAIAEREHRVKRLAAAMSQERADTKVNVERKQGMTERERQMELNAMFADSAVIGGAAQDEDSGDESDGSEKVYNPLKLPLSWDGKPIPFWLYKLHGLGVEFPCEICANFVYMGRRAFDKHFNEARHIYGLKCLGITSTTLFREITGIGDALKLWDKIQREKKKEAKNDGGVEMEDGDGNVMPERVYLDLQKQGLL